MIFQKATQEHLNEFFDDGFIFENKLYTLNQASKMSGKHRDTLSNKAKKGYLKIVRDVAGKPFIIGSDLIKFLSVK